MKRAVYTRIPVGTISQPALRAHISLYRVNKKELILQFGISECYWCSADGVLMYDNLKGFHYCCYQCSREWYSADQATLRQLESAL